jgi:hypothetical protein
MKLLLFLLLCGCATTSPSRFPASTQVSHGQYLAAYEHVKPDQEPMPPRSVEDLKAAEEARIQYGLSADEADAIYAYTARFYYVNKTLRQAHPSAAALTYAAVVNNGLEKLPPYEGTVYRNFWPFPGYRERYAEQELPLETAFTSTSDKFGDGPMMSEKEPIRFIIQSKTGRNISAFSAHRTSETEILFRTNTRFHVSKVETVSNFQDYNHNPLTGTQIIMEEVE